MSGIDVVLHQLQPGRDDGFHTWPCSKAVDEEFFTYCLAEMGVSAAVVDEKKLGEQCAKSLAPMVGARETG